MMRTLNTARDTLLGEQMPDGCVRGCPKRRNNDTSHNYRCADVREAIQMLLALIEATKS